MSAISPPALETVRKRSSSVPPWLWKTLGSIAAPQPPAPRRASAGRAWRRLDAVSAKAERCSLPARTGSSRAPGDGHGAAWRHIVPTGPTRRQRPAARAHRADDSRGRAGQGAGIGASTGSCPFVRSDKLMLWPVSAGATVLGTSLLSPRRAPLAASGRQPTTLPTDVPRPVPSPGAVASGRGRRRAPRLYHRSTGSCTQRSFTGERALRRSPSGWSWAMQQARSGRRSERKWQREREAVANERGLIGAQTMRWWRRGGGSRIWASRRVQSRWQWRRRPSGTADGCALTPFLRTQSDRARLPVRGHLLMEIDPQP